MIMYDSDDAAHIQTVSGWVSSTGKFYGNDEHFARIAGCTHRRCENEGCTNIVEKRYTACDKCREDKKDKEFDELPKVHWDGETPLMMYDSDVLFFDRTELYDFCYDHDIQASDLKVLLCKPVPYPRFDIYDFLYVTTHEDREIPDEVIAAAENLNAALNKMKPQLWQSTNVAAILPL